MSLVRRTARGLVVAALIALPAGSAWPCATPTNLVTNCGFDDGGSGWPFGLLLDPDNGQPAPSALLDAHPVYPGGMYLATTHQCIATVTPSTAYGFGVRMQLASGAPSSCAVTIDGYSNGTCQVSGFIASASGPVSPPGATWQLSNASFEAWPGTLSVKLGATCYGNVPFTVRADDFFLGQGLTPVELQSLSIE